MSRCLSIVHPEGISVTTEGKRQISVFDIAIRGICFASLIHPRAGFSELVLTAVKFGVKNPPEDDFGKWDIAHWRNRIDSERAAYSWRRVGFDSLYPHKAQWAIIHQ